MAMPSTKKIYTWQELSQHNTKDDCWLLIGDKIYDVSKFLNEHPGGPAILLSSTGKDATEDFEDNGHSGYAYKLMQKFVIGEIDKNTIPEMPPRKRRFFTKRLLKNTVKYVILPTAAIGIPIAIAVYVYSRKKN